MAVRLDQNTCHNVAWVPHTAALGPSAAWGTQLASFSVKQRKFQICILIGIAIMFGPAGATQAPTDTLSMMSVAGGQLRGRPCTSSERAGQHVAGKYFDTLTAGATQAPTDTLYLMSVAGGRVRGRPWSSSVLAGKTHTWQTLLTRRASSRSTGGGPPLAFTQGSGSTTAPWDPFGGWQVPGSSPVLRGQNHRRFFI